MGGFTNIMNSIKNFISNYKHIWLLGYAFIYIPWFLYLEKTVTSDYHLIYNKLDDYIPFNEYFIVPYLLWFFYVACTLIFFFFKSTSDYYKTCAFLFIGMTISLIVCTIYPNGTNLRPIIDADKNIFTAMVTKLYSKDTCTNVLPSIHVFNSIVIHNSIIHSPLLKKYKKLKCASFILMVLICIATVTLKQHSIVDVIASIIMFCILYPLIYRTKISCLLCKDKAITEKICR